MRIRLILPKDSAENPSPLEFRFITRILKGVEGSGCIPLALPTLAALTPPELDVRITDENLEPVDFGEEVDVVGISYITSAAPRAYQIADAFRERGKVVALGGFHASQFPREALDHADSVFVGEAEDTWPKFLQDVRNKRALSIYRNETRPDLQQCVVPRWDLVRTSRYYYYHVQAGRGCRFHCDFCQVRKMLGPVRTKPVEHVLTEIEAVRKLSRMPGRDAITFADDNIIADPAYAKRLFQALISLNISWTSQCSLNITQDQELLDIATRSGCRALLIGFESILQESLDGTNKGGVNRVAHYRDAIASLRSRNINIFGSFVFGFDQDNADVFERTLQFVAETDMTFPMFHILTPIPGTRLYDRLQEEGRILHHRWSAYNGGAVCFRPEKMTVEELHQGYNWISRESYSAHATFARIQRLWSAGALRAEKIQILMRILVSVKLLSLILGSRKSKKELSAFLRGMLRELWEKKGIAMGSLGLYVALFEYARGLPAADPPRPNEEPMIHKKGDEAPPLIP